MLVYFLLSIITGFGLGQDPCSDRIYTMLPDLSKRSPSFLEDLVPLCDRYLSMRWYRAGGSHQIPTTAPSLFSCGTLYPYWMKGSLPASGAMATVKMCQVGFSSTCVRFHTIRVKNCRFYFVYELTPLPVCNSAYCFEGSRTCVKGVPTDISVAYHNVTWKTFTARVPHPKKTMLVVEHGPTVNLICKFLPLSKKNLFYHVTWYVDNVEVQRNQTVSADQTDRAILSVEDIFYGKKKAGSMIHCVVGAKLKATGYPCTTNSSPPFFAGIKVWPTKFMIKRRKSATLYLQLTIPFADQVIVEQNKESQPTLNIALVPKDNSSACSDNETLEVNNCGIKIPAYTFSERHRYATDEWKQPHKMVIHNMDGGGYTINKRLTLRLRAEGTSGVKQSSHFENVTLPDVQVQILEDDSLWKGKVCKSTSDPNLKTFDGKSYSCFLNGSFILYRNERYNQEVQEKHFPCYPGVTCNCAAAVRSGRDIFTIDICRGQGQRERINFPLCDDKILKVTKLTDRRYRVLLPTGTIVMIKITSWRNVWFLNIHITASSSDLKNTRGLCGKLDGNSANDYLGRDNKIKDKEDNFSRTWLVNEAENLLNESRVLFNGLTSISKTLIRVCTCLKNTTEWKTSCTYGNQKDCKFNTGKKFSCILDEEGIRRRKRDLTYLNSRSRTIKEERSYSGNLDARRYKRETVMPFTEARNACLTEFEKSVPFRNCEKHVLDLGKSSLASCISDLSFTGDLSFTAIHIEAALEECSTFIVLNSTFQRVEKEITHQIQSLCPSNCSGNGICIKGNCRCYSRYAGSDCSFDLLGPPTISLISNFGFCDKSEEACDDITLYGRYFLENMNTKCYTTRRRITENGSYVLLDYFEKKLEERTLFEGYCPLEYAKTPTWVTYFTFNISNDGRNFTENYNVYTYQSLCQEYHNDSGKISFTFKDGYCFVDGRCIADGKSNPSNKCDVCNVEKNKYSWTFNDGHCYINGRCIADGEMNIANPCEFCDTSSSVMSWSISSEFCYINAVCYFDGENRENSDCEICDIDNNRYGWTITEDGYCLINGQCVREGEHDSRKECHVCNPVINKRDWSIDSDGYCFIKGSCVRDGEHATLEECKICSPASNITDWSFDSDFCFINNVCYFDGENRENSDCEICNIDNNRYGWTITEDGYCLINGQCVREGEHDLKKECHVCNPVINKRDWSIDSDSYCFINGSCVRDGEHATLEKCKVCNPASNVKDWSFDSVAGTYCIINGRCVNQGERDTINECNICNPALNDKDWSIESGCSTVTKQTKAEFTTTESTIVTTELLSFTTMTEASASTKILTNLTKSGETSKTPVSTASAKVTTESIKSMESSKTPVSITSSATTMTVSTAIETTTTKSTLQPIITKTPKYMTKETTKTGIEPTRKTTASYATAEKTISITTKAKETDQAVKVATTKKIIKETMPTETSITFEGMTKPISVKQTTISMTTNPTSKDKRTTIITKTPTYMTKETTKTGIEPTRKTTASYTIAEKTISVTTKAKETDQAVKGATTKKIIKETMPTETSITFEGMTKPISVKQTTISMTTNPTSKDKRKQIVTDPVTTETTRERTRSDQTTEQTTMIKIMTDQVSVESSTVRAPESTKTKKPSVYIKEVSTTTFPKATTPVSTESTHLTKFTEVLTSISTCCATTTDYAKSPKSSAVHQYTVLAVSVAAPAFFVLVIIVIACFIHCYRKSHTAVVLQASIKANNKMDMKEPFWMRQTKTKSADDVFSDSEFGMNISGNKYSKFSEEDNPFST